MDRERCPSPEALRAFASGDLDEAELDDVTGHLERCGACTEAVARLDDQPDAILDEVRRRVVESAGRASRSGADGSTVRPAAPAGAIGPTERLGDFRIVREIGRGGMGIVYEAFQGSLNRHVALKVLREPADLARFRREARSAGRLHHTNIVPVHGVGHDAGRDYLVMQYIDGRGLDRVLRGPRGDVPGRGAAAPAFDHREAARIVLQAAEAVAYAHAQGVVHRDIKPSNILLDGHGTAWVTDFGLAADAADAEALTHTGDVLGTLRYMAPERFSGGGDGRADIYGLGSTLYELATGRPAFADADRAVLVNRVLNEAPPRPRQVAPRLPRDLETIILRAMAREPSRRYATAAELADDLRRFLDDRAIRARRVGPSERAARWCRRNPLAAGLLAGLVVVFLSGFAAVTVLWRRAQFLAEAEAAARADESRLRARAQAEVAARDFDRGLELARRGEADLGMLWMAEALREAPPEEPALPRLIRANLSAWEGSAPRLRAVFEHGGNIDAVAFRPDGHAVLTGGHDGTARLWDAATGQPLGPPLAHGGMVFCAAFAADGRRVLTGGFGGRVRTWDPQTGRHDGPELAAPGEVAVNLTVFDGGRRILTFDPTAGARFWEAATGRPLGPPVGPRAFRSAEVLGDGRRLLTGGEDGLARAWDVATGAPTGRPLRHGSACIARSSPDGRVIATGGNDGAVILWDATTGRRIAESPRQDNAIQEIRFSPDGRRLLVLGRDAGIRLGDAAAGHPTAHSLPHAGQIRDARFSPDGRLVATAGGDHTARLWDAATGRAIGSPLRHRLDVNRVAFSPDGRLLMTTADGTARIWEVGPVEVGAVAARLDGPPTAAEQGLAAPGPGPAFNRAGFGPGAVRVLLREREGPAQLVDARSSQPAGPPIRERWPRIRTAAFSPDGRLLAIASTDRPYFEGGGHQTTYRLWDVEAGRPASSLLPHIDWVAATAFRPDGDAVATGDYSGAVHLWDARSGARLAGPLDAGCIVLSLAFSPDGNLLAAGTAETAFRAVAWDLRTGRPLCEPIRFRSSVEHLTFSDDGALLAALANDATVRFLKVGTGRLLGEPLRFGGHPRGIAFSPNGRSLLTAGVGGDGTSTARLWDVRSGRPASPVMAHPAIIGWGAIAFAPGGERIATGCDDGTVRVWDAATGRTIGPTRSLRGPALAVAFDRDGRTLIAADAHGLVRAWSLPPSTIEPVAQLVDRVRTRTGIELDDTRDVAVLGPEGWRRARDAIGEPSSAGRDEDEDRHEACARDAEAIGEGFAARWHLDRLIAARPDDGMLHARRALARLCDGDAAGADEDLDRAVAAGPRDGVMDWLEHRAADSLSDGQPARAMRLLDRVISARPGDWLARALRAEARAAIGRSDEREPDLAAAIALGADIPFIARLADERARAGRWVEAAALYDRAIALGTVPYEVWTQAAIAHLEIGDEAGYGRVCAVMRGRHPADLPEPRVRARLATVLTLGPGGLGDDGKGLAWMATLPADVGASRRPPRRWALRVLGAMLYRAGRPGEAIERIREGMATGNGRPDIEEAAFLAMAYHRAGDGAGARAALPRPVEGDPSSEGWWAAAALRVLGREAIRVVLDDDFPASPFGP